MKCCLGFFCLLLTIASVEPVALHAAVRVHVIFSDEAPKLERFAAQELAEQFRKLFADVEVVAAAAVPKDAQYVVLVGSPKTNRAVKDTLGLKWPDVSDQGLVIKSFADGERQGLIVGGGSPKATLWAVYELGHRYGIRYLLREDIFPLKRSPLKLKGFDVVMEPQFRTRTWRTVNDFAIGPESWPLEDHKRFLRQLVKMKYNDLMLSIYPWQPFVHYEFGGVKKQTAVQWFGERFRVDGETAGKKVFRGAKFFENPDFARKTSYEEMTAAGIGHLRGIIDEAHRLGMQVGISISPIEFPREFQSVLPGSQVTHSINALTILPGGRQGPNNATLKKLVATKIRAYLTTYPSIDSLYLTLPEFPEWDQHAPAAWKQLASQRDMGDLTLEQLIATAKQRNLIASGKRGEQSVKGNLVTLAFLNNLFRDGDLLRRPNRSAVDLVITSVDPALFPVLDRVIPPGASALNFIDYTARRILENRKLLSLVPAKKVRCRLILTLADDNVGVLPQSALNSLGTLLEEIRKLGWDGFSTRYWVPAELDSSVFFLSQAAWDARVTPRSAHDDLWVTITGNKSAAERLWIGWQHLEQATELIDKHDLGFAFPVKGMMTKHDRAVPLPPWWNQLIEHYNQLTIELYRAHGAIDPRARKLLFYYAKRAEYALQYLGAVQAVRESALANKADNSELAVEKLEAAVESMYNGITSLADVAGDQSDRGLIAVLNQYAYRPLLAKYERLIDSE